MNTKTATITIEMEGGFEIDFSKNHLRPEGVIILSESALILFSCGFLERKSTVVTFD